MSVIVVVFAGEYDISHKDDFRAELHAVRDEGDLVLDMSAVSYIDSTCITELFDMQAHRTTTGLGNASIVRSTPSILRLFEILKLDRMFRVAATVDEVLPKDRAAVSVRNAVRGDESIVALARPLTR